MTSCSCKAQRWLLLPTLWQPCALALAADGFAAQNGIWPALALALLVGVVALAVAVRHYVRSLNRQRTENARIEGELAERNEQFRKLSETAAAGIFILKNGRFIMVSEGMVRYTGFSEAELLAMEQFELVHPDQQQAAVGIAQARLRGESVPTTYEKKLLTRSGEERWIRVSVAPVTYHGEDVFMGIALDITQRRQMEEELRRSEERHRILADHASDVIWTMDIASALQGRFSYLSPSVEKLLGYTHAEVLGMSIDQTLTPESAAIAKSAIAESIRAAHEGRPIEQFRAEIEQYHKDGSRVWTEVSASPMFDQEGRLVGILGVTRDVSERKRILHRIEHMAQFDSLTELPNRALFQDRLQRALTGANRESHKLALLYLDLDGFKPVNDNYGHAVGDVLLKEAARRMLSVVRASDTVGRIGGDEFVILLPKVHTTRDAILVAEKIRDALNQPFELTGQTLIISASIGIAFFPEHGSDELDLARKADIAMYRAKDSGRNNVQIYGEARGQQRLF